MKRAYIKPEMELLDSELNVILCVSTGTDYNMTGEGEGTVTVTVAKGTNLVATNENGKDWSNTDTRESTTVTVEE